MMLQFVLLFITPLLTAAEAGMGAPGIAAPEKQQHLSPPSLTEFLLENI